MQNNECRQSENFKWLQGLFNKILARVEWLVGCTPDFAILLTGNDFLKILFARMNNE